MADSSIARLQLTATLVALIAQEIAKARGAIGPDQHLCMLPSTDQRALRQTARFAINPQTLADEMALYLRRNLAVKLHRTTFDKLPLAERYAVAETAETAWQTVLDVLTGRTTDLPGWELDCLSFTGAYDPAHLLGRDDEGPVQ